MSAHKDPINVSWNPNMKLIVISTDVGKGEQTLLTLTPSEAVKLGEVLTRYGEERGGKIV